MKRALLRFCIFLAVTSFILVTFFLPAPPEAEANLCKVPRGGIPSIYMTEVNAMAGDVFRGLDLPRFRGELSTWVFRVCVVVSFRS